MKKILGLLLVLMLVTSLSPMILADGDDAGVGGGVIVEPPMEECYDPVIYVDHTARGWYPNDQTIYTAEEYGQIQSGGKYSCGPEYDRFAVSARQNYVFEGETVDYYVLIRDENGVADINKVQLVVEEAGIPTVVGSCAVAPSQCTAPDKAAFGIDAFKSKTDKMFICKLIVPDKQGTWASGEKEVRVKVVDGALDNGCTPAEDITSEADLTYFNPTLSLTVTGGPIDFGTVNPGTTATSNSVYLKNEDANDEESGVVMDVYIASDDYFTDPDNPEAICPTGNGIKYTQFSYWATKGSLNSGANNNAYPALGAEGETCVANSDEFTPLPSHSGEIGDMCRIINWKKGASLLTQGSDMSLTFRLAVPETCSGRFDNGQFHFKGRVV